MNIIEALKFKYMLNKFIEKWLRLSINYDEIWESYLTEEDYHTEFSKFLRTRIGHIWLKGHYGQTYLKWQSQ